MVASQFQVNPAETSSPIQFQFPRECHVTFFVLPILPVLLVLRLCVDLLRPLAPILIADGGGPNVKANAGALPLFSWTYHGPSVASEERFLPLFQVYTVVLSGPNLGGGSVRWLVRSFRSCRHVFFAHRWNQPSIDLQQRDKECGPITYRL